MLTFAESATLSIPVKIKVGDNLNIHQRASAGVHHWSKEGNVKVSKWYKEKAPVMVGFAPGRGTLRIGEKVGDSGGLYIYDAHLDLKPNWEIIHSEEHPASPALGFKEDDFRATAKQAIINNPYLEFRIPASKKQEMDAVTPITLPIECIFMGEGDASVPTNSLPKFNLVCAVDNGYQQYQWIANYMSTSTGFAVEGTMSQFLTNSYSARVFVTAKVSGQFHAGRDILNFLTGDWRVQAGKIDFTTNPPNYLQHYPFVWKDNFEVKLINNAATNTKLALDLVQAYGVISAIEAYLDLGSPAWETIFRQFIDGNEAAENIIGGLGGLVVPGASLGAIAYKAFVLGTPGAEAAFWQRIAVAAAFLTISQLYIGNDIQKTKDSLRDQVEDMLDKLSDYATNSIFYNEVFPQANQCNRIGAQSNVKIKIEPGWKLIAFPILQTTSVSSFGLDAVWGWNKDTQDWVVYTKDPNGLQSINNELGTNYQPLTHVDPSEGYWVRNAGSETITLTGTYSSNFRAILRKGWNLIANNRFEALHPAAFLSQTRFHSGAPDSIISVWTYDAEVANENRGIPLWRVWSPTGVDELKAFDPSLKDMVQIKPGTGMWIRYGGTSAFLVCQ